MFKKILVVIVAIIILAIVGLVVFLKTLNINRYKDTITDRIGKTIGRKVTIKDMSLEFSIKKGVTLEVSSLNVQDDPEFIDDSLFYVDSAHLNLDLISLISSRRVFISRVQFDSPRINIVRNSDGILNVQNLDRKKVPITDVVTEKPGPIQDKAAPPAKETEDLAFGDVMIQSIRIGDGTMIYTDKSSTPPIVIPVTKLDLEVSNLSVETTVPFKASAQLWSRKKNIHVSGLAHIRAGNRQLRVDDLKVKTDIADWDLQAAAAAMPGIAADMVPDNFRGLFELNIQQMILGEDGLLVFSSDGKFSEGLVEMDMLPVPINDIDLNFDVSNTDVEIKPSSVGMASGKIHLSGKLVDYLSDQKFIFNIDADGIQLAELAAPYNLPFDVVGRIVMKQDVRGDGFETENLEQLMSGDGQIDIIDGKVKDLNILKTVLSKISFVPDLSAKIEQNLPERYKEKLKQRDTILEEVSISTSLRQGAVNVNEAVVRADGFKTVGQGKIDLRQNMIFRATFFIPADLSESLIKAAPELDYLKNDTGEIEIPLKPYNGPIAKFRMYPDVGDIGAEIIQNRGREELKKAIYRGLGIEDEAQEPATEEGAQPQEKKQPRPEEIIIENILNNIPIFE